MFSSSSIILLKIIFLNPKIMALLGVVPSEEAFYEMFLEKWKEYLHKIRSGKKLREVLGKDLETVEDVKATWRRFGFISGDTICMIFFMEDTKSRRQTFWNVIFSWHRGRSFGISWTRLSVSFILKAEPERKRRGQRI